MTREEAINEIKSWDFLEGKEIEAIHTLIPELRESEDERIRKEIVGLIEELQRSDKYFAGVELTDMLAYLEKQKESGIKWLKSDNVKNPEKPYIDKAGMFYTTDGRMCYASEIEKQKEQKQEWSESDKQNINLIISYLDSYIKEHNDTFGADECKYLKYWLKSLSSNLKKKNEDVAKLCSNEWSEEDENVLKYLHELIGYGYVQRYMDAQTAHDMLAWVNEHFHPGTSQNGNSYWKPSEHQMTILKAVKDYVGVGSGYWGEALGSLIEDLEKL